MGVAAGMQGPGHNPPPAPACQSPGALGAPAAHTLPLQHQSIALWQEIAAEAGVSKPVLYASFTDKSALAAAGAEGSFWQPVSRTIHAASRAPARTRTDIGVMGR